MIDFDLFDDPLGREISTAIKSFINKVIGDHWWNNTNTLLISARFVANLESLLSSSKAPIRLGNQLGNIFFTPALIRDPIIGRVYLRFFCTGVYLPVIIFW